MKEARKLLADGVDSYIGHKDTANVVSNVLGIEVPAQRRYGKILPGKPSLLHSISGVGYRKEQLNFQKVEKSYF